MTSNSPTGLAAPSPAEEQGHSASAPGQHRVDGPATPSLAAVVVSYNTRELLGRCLESLRQAGAPLRTLVVDNGSSDGSVELVRASYPEVELIEAGANLGFARANNRALWRLGFAEQGQAGAAASAAGPPPDYVLLLNPDAELRPGALPRLVEFLERHPRVGVVAPRLRYADESHQPGAFRFPTLLMSLLDFFPPRGPLLGRLYASPLNGRYPQDGGAEPFAIDHPLGAAMLVRGATIRQVGAFDERYWLYAEEVDWCYRIRQAGWAIWQQPAAEAIHVAGASSSQFRARSYLALQRSRLIFFRRFYGPRFLRWHRRVARLAATRDLLKGALAVLRGRRDEQVRARMLAAGELLTLLDYFHHGDTEATKR